MGWKRLALARRNSQILPLFEFRTERPLLRLILHRMWHRPFVLEHLSKIAAIDPPAAPAGSG
jgi:hypothetical protein